ncbi:hypothetical protein V6N13_004986 [Hibiscus sabdariffa]|uniref:Uncharacterized protein n=1 Tax=Hibiscus sabdariffa TaxID=183260 RepID=A0ABR2S0I8_9ROSI
MVHYQALAFDGSESNIPSEKPCVDAPELVIPTMDLGAVPCWSDPLALSEAEAEAVAVSEACKRHGFFLVVNHGVDSGLIDKAHQFRWEVQFSSKLPWKETLHCLFGFVLITLQTWSKTICHEQAIPKDLFEENDSILRLNHYPPCQKPDWALGTGPHSEPLSDFLQVFSHEKWHSIAPIPGAFLVNVGDTLMRHYRADMKTLDAFSKWVQEQESTEK